MISKQQIVHRVVRSKFVRRAYGAFLPVPILGHGLRHMAHAMMPTGARLWIRVPEGVGAGLWMFADLRIELGYADGGHEPWLQELLKSQLAAGDCYYDLGSHAGFFALIAARQVGPTGAVLAVEPDPDNVQVVQANVARNKLAQITLLQAAVWSSNTHLNFQPNLDSTQGHVSSNGHSQGGAISVQAVCLDDLVFREGYRAPTLIKMDVEGAEWEALHGARRVLTEAKPKLLCEVHDPAQMEQICTLLKGYGYLTEKWQPVDPNNPGYHQLYVWAVKRS